MKTKEIIELIDFISNSELNEVKIETDEIKIDVKKGGNEPTILEPIVQQIAAPAPAAIAAPAVAQAPAAPAAAPAVSVEKPTIKSPMIGTFYRASNPDIPNFVNIGDKVEKGQTVCIIEAMKLFNEIEAEISGTIVECLVENAQPVEFDQPLFTIDPS